MFSSSLSLRVTYGSPAQQQAHASLQHIWFELSHFVEIALIWCEELYTLFISKLCESCALLLRKVIARFFAPLFLVLLVSCVCCGSLVQITSRYQAHHPHPEVIVKMVLPGFIESILNWFRSLFWKQEMELTLVGLQNSGKTTLVNVIAVCIQMITFCITHNNNILNIINIIHTFPINLMFRS